MTRWLIITDLDGTLLDPGSYSWEAAREALDLIQARRIPLILASSKTRTEIERLRVQLKHEDPFIVENGGALFIPKGLFVFPLDGATLRGPYQIVEIGSPYARLRTALKELEQETGVSVRGFGDMSPDEIAELSGLSLGQATLAKQREYDEPFLVIGGDNHLDAFVRKARSRGLTYTRGGRFHHLLGPSDKGRACRYIIDCYRRAAGPQATLTTVALGDALNDRPMLDIVDRPILIKSGPAEWNEAVLRLLQMP